MVYMGGFDFQSLERAAHVAERTHVRMLSLTGDGVWRMLIHRAGPKEFVALQQSLAAIRPVLTRVRLGHPREHAAALAEVSVPGLHLSFAPYDKESK